MHPPDIFYPHIRFLPLGMTTIIISFVDGNGHYRLNQPQDERSALTSASSLRSPYPTNKSPFPAQSTGKGGFLIHPQNFSCSPLTIPLS